MANDWLQPLFALPSDDVAPNATVTVTSGTAETEYPASFLVNRNPAKPSKSTGTAITYRFTWSGNQIIEAIAIINHNLDGATVTLSNAAGANEVLAIPDNTPGLYPNCTNAWYDLRELATLSQRTDDVWDLAITGGALGNVAIGEVLFITDLREMRLKWGLKLSPARSVIRHKTFGGSLLQYHKRVQVRSCAASVDLQSDQELWTQLEQEASGQVVPFLFIPDEAVNDAWYVQLQGDSFSQRPTNPGIIETPLEMVEVSPGPPLFP